MIQLKFKGLSLAAVLKGDSRGARVESEKPVRGSPNNPGCDESSWTGGVALR